LKYAGSEPEIILVLPFTALPVAQARGLTREFVMVYTEGYNPALRGEDRELN
jgi:hypothetical protein